jgi:CubicO group peptidase (beta-lactamase class C family)
VTSPAGSVAGVANLGTWLPDLQSTLDERRAAIGVPGAVVGVLLGDEEVVAVSGVANVGTGEAVHPGTLFQLGAISKLYTTALVLQAERAGLVDLDEPVRAVLHELRLGDPAATLEVTPRHLLTHTSGIEGDHLFASGRDDDALARFVAGLDGIGQVHPPDEMYSYCNTGFTIAGRVVEVLTGEHFDRLLRRRLTRPLGGDATMTLPEHALLHRVAVGHLQTPGGEPARQGVWTLTRANGPTGGIMAPAGDVLAFARLLIGRGVGPSGSEVLAPESIAASFEPHVEHPDGLARRGLGWMIEDWGGVPAFGHDGDTVGQRAHLRVVPDRRAAVVVLTNSSVGSALARELVDTIAGDLLELAVPATPPADPGATPTAAEAADRAGTYERLHQRVEVRADGTDLHLRVEPDDAMRAVGTAPADLGPLEPLGADRFAAVDPRTGVREVVTFLDPDDAGHPTYLHEGGRAHRLAGP